MAAALEGVSVTAWPLFTPGKDPVLIVQEAGWAPGLVWTGVENLVRTGTRSPDHPVHSQSLYRLRYPAHFFTEWYFSKQDPLWSRTTQNLQIDLVSLCFLCAAHTLHCLAGYFFFSLLTSNNFFQFVKSPDSLPRWSCLGPLGVVCFSGNRRSSELDSLWFWTSDIQDLPTSCRKCLYFTF